MFHEGHDSNLEGQLLGMNVDINKRLSLVDGGIIVVNEPTLAKNVCATGVSILSADTVPSKPTRFGC